MWLGCRGRGHSFAELDDLAAYVSMYVCAYVYIYIYTCIYIHMYIYIYMFYVMLFVSAAYYIVYMYIYIYTRPRQGLRAWPTIDLSVGDPIVFIGSQVLR